MPCLLLRIISPGERISLGHQVLLPQVQTQSGISCYFESLIAHTPGGEHLHSMKFRNCSVLSFRNPTTTAIATMGLELLFFELKLMHPSHFHYNLLLMVGEIR